VKRLGILVFLVLLIGIVIVGIVVSRKEAPQKPSKDIEHVVVKQLSFETADSLGGWDEKVLTRYRTDYSLAEHKGERCVKAESKNSASSLFIKEPLSRSRRPFVSWDWIVAKFPERKEEETLDDKKEFDFGAQVYVIFKSRFFLTTKAIQYVWTEKLPVGTVSDSPYTKNVKLMVLESGPSNEWKHETRDVKEDFRTLFGEEMTRDVEAFAFMTDSDSTDSSAIAYFGNIRLGYIESVKERGNHQEH